MQSGHPEVQSHLDQVVSTLTIHVGAELIGVYLHGSLAMGRSTPDGATSTSSPCAPSRFTVSGAWY